MLDCQGTDLWTSGRFGTNVLYIPHIKPLPPSPLRQLAYDQRLPLVALDEDPQGWQSLPPHTFTGTLFGKQDVEVTYTVSAILMGW